MLSDTTVVLTRTILFYYTHKSCFVNWIYFPILFSFLHKN
ncbi:Hypothetical protein EUBREC_0976 [Agathobacter rectalis ATCC 33656]|uniref:Uncharacterized protein n=1 Tax=Agathobacter rectalis (strain ATCC 33656 / DSM 3377 / JCM 17463 / KCTC 5835 / VPI 0990) TaxID=515619 RepID=C4ZGE1_AGARV|nr:Hypothetical protein EUBREC_0976 [Agathobacter rectalis ATCC 33656]